MNSTLTERIVAELEAHSCGRTATRNVLAALDVAGEGYVVVPRNVVAGVIKSFRDVEGSQLYDAATHRWIDLLAEQAGLCKHGGNVYDCADKKLGHR